MKKRLFQWLLIAMVMVFCSLVIAIPLRHMIPSSPKPINQSTHEEIIAPYSPESINETSKNFDRFTTFLVPGIIKSSPLSASFMYGNLKALGLEKLKSELDQLSPEAFQSEIERAHRTLSDLKTMDYDLLTKSQQATYDMLLFQSRLIVESQPFAYYDPIIEPSSGLQTNLPLSLIQINLENEGDIQSYLLRLAQIPRLFNQLIDYENVRLEKGLTLPANHHQLVLDQIEGLLVDPEDFLIYLDFSYKINAIKTLTSVEKDAYKNQCLTLIKDDIYPAYGLLKTTIEQIKTLSTSDLGVSSWDNGKAYYEYLIYKETSYNLSAEALRSWVRGEMQACATQIKGLYANHPELLEISNLSALLPTYGSLEELYAIEARCLEELFYDYGIQRASEHIIPSYLEDYVAAGFYFPVSIDGNHYGNMYLQEGAYTTLDATTLELYFHENIPGHHMYFSKFYSSDLPMIRKVSSWLPYEEGWAQYIQNVSIDYFGLSEPLTQLLKISSKLSYYYMLLIDIEYHYDGISPEAAISNYVELGYSKDSATKAVTRMIAHPGEIIHYIYGGYKIESYRTQCEKALGERFDIKAFHDMILNHAELPFTTMDQVIETYIKTQNQNPGDGEIDNLKKRDR